MTKTEQNRDPVTGRVLKGGRIALKHGLFSVKGRANLLRAHPEIRVYLRAVRRGLIRDICPEGEIHLTMAKRVILDRLLSKLARVHLIETFLDANGIIRRDMIKLKILDAEPITHLWTILNVQIREDLKLLGLERKPLEAIVLSPAELLLEAARDVEEEDAAAGLGTGARGGDGDA